MSLEDEFCDIVKKARMGQERSAREVAEKTGLVLEELERLEKGKRKPSSREVEALGEALGLKIPSLVAVALQGWIPQLSPHWINYEGPVITVLGDIGGYAVKGYILFDSETREAALIDTGYNAQEMLKKLNDYDLTLKGVCLTHGHADHAGGLDEILKQWTVPVFLGDGDCSLLPWKPSRERLFLPNHQQVIEIGKLAVHCLATPGHTPGGFCYRVDWREHELCFVGDTLFAGSIGRSNPFSLYSRHLQSVREEVLALPQDTVLLPGHGPATTVKEERVYNPFG